MNKKILAIIFILIIGIIVGLLFTSIEPTVKNTIFFTVTSVILVGLLGIIIVETVLEVVAPKLYDDMDILVDRAKVDANASALVLLATSLRIVGYAIILHGAITAIAVR